MKKIFVDAVLGFLFVLSIILFFSSITYFRIFDIFDPIGDMFEDFEFTDLVMSQMREAPPADENILLVNIGELDRIGIAQQLQIISRYNPAIIGVDVLLDSPKDPYQDSVFAATLDTVPNVVLATKMLYNPHTDSFDSLLKPIPAFLPQTELAHVNLITGAGNQDEMKVCRSFTPSEQIEDSLLMALSVRMAQVIDPVRVDKFLQRSRSEELINFRGNVFDYGATEYGTRYFALDVQDVLFENFVPEIVEGKIVIFCFLGEYFGDRNTREDIFFTPLNKKYVGKTEPDMFGGVIHANIVSMILNEDYLEQMGEKTAKFWALLLGFINVFFFTIIYKSLPNWYDGITKILQLLQVLILITIMVYVLHYYNYKIDFSYAIIIILLAGDSIEVYHGVVKNLFSKRGRRELTTVRKIF
ncbi:MAG: CHASE2 domain-containing protein [Cyclobacteriaceae bacterium]